MLQERIEEVTQANEAFYQAFENLDVGAMDRIWAHQEYVTCIHPGWSIRVGWPGVRDSWVVIFNNTFSMKFHLTEFQIQVAADIAWVICTENIESRVGGKRPKQPCRGHQSLRTNPRYLETHPPPWFTLDGIASGGKRFMHCMDFGV